MKREGYIDSIFGLIPEEWKVITLGDITLEHKQGFYTKEKYQNEGVKLIRITDLGNPKINYKFMPKLKMSEKDFEFFKVEKNDFLFARSGAIGRYGIVEDDHEKAVFASYIIRFQFDNEYLLNRHMGYFYESNYVQKQLNSIIQGSSNININANNIKSLKIVLPSITEQQKIVEILSSIDDQIETTEQLIAETKELKQGLMQQLLTKGIGHTKFIESELGEIPTNWHVKTFNEIGEFYKGKGIAKKDITEAGNPCILYGHLYTTYNEQIKKVCYFTNIEVKNPLIGLQNDLLIPSSGETPIDIATSSALLEDNILIGGDINLFRPKDGIDSRYLSYQINYVRKTDLANLAQGSSIFHLYAPIIENFKLIVPPLKEQQKIANILSSVDDQTEIYEQEKAEFEQLKRGLMQKLLTGQIRVKVEEVSV